MLAFNHKLHTHSPCSPENYSQGRKGDIIHLERCIIAKCYIHIVPVLLKIILKGGKEVLFIWKDV